MIYFLVSYPQVGTQFWSLVVYRSSRVVVVRIGPGAGVIFTAQKSGGSTSSCVEGLLSYANPRWAPRQSGGSGAADPANGTRARHTCVEGGGGGL